LVNESKKIDAHIIYKTDTSDESCRVLKGILILCAQPTHPDTLARNFPNFTISRIPSNFELDFWNLKDVSILGKHPYKDIKTNLFKTLFSQKSLSGFMETDRKSKK